MTIPTTAETYNLVKVSLKIADESMSNWDSVASAAQLKFASCFVSEIRPNRMRVDNISNDVLIAAAQAIPAPEGCTQADYEATIADGSLPGVQALVSLSTSSSPLDAECIEDAQLFCSAICAPCPMGSACEVNADCVNNSCYQPVNQDIGTCRSNAFAASIAIAIAAIIAATLF